ncbi:chemotaxis protein CheC [Tepidibacillus fermentans]|uniref:Chemotaxis protein CheC n=1 Tax=Tepidibacillus fermentans TaxID=1281767 RepID=A0A4R3KI10_9BACI|nr:chemotaxis protein CheC [Tepidibacillus fermentans]TCS82961.1 chemotaxis protein CheC [Tepidibacillus fermentans]
MTKELHELKDIQLDFLKEVGNIGAAHAATALSKMIKKTIEMNVPKVKILPFEEVEELLGGSDQIMVCIFLRVEGDAPGNMLFMMTIDSAKKLLKEILGPMANQQKFFSDLENSALNELGNILAGSYLSSLADFTNLKLYPTVPAITIDMVGAILSFGLIQVSQFSDVAIVIDTTFFEGQQLVEGHFFLIPDTESFSTLFSALGVPWE